MPTTPRLLLRPWQPADRASLVALNADPAVMRHSPALMTAADTDAMLERIHAHFAQHGYGLWAAELRATGEGIGLREIVSFTTPANLPSRRVMAKIGMTHNPAEDFDHPALPEAHPLRRHVLYRSSRNG